MTIGDGFEPHGELPLVGKIVNLGQPATIVQPSFPRHYDVIDDMAREIREVINRYAGQVPLAVALGVLRTTEHDLIRDHHGD